MTTLGFIRRVFPNACDAHGEIYAAAVAAFEEYPILREQIQAQHFWAQVGHETGGLTRTVESFAYSAERLLEVFPSHFRDLGDAEAVRRAGWKAIAERVYGGRLGNGPEGSGDASRFPGRGWFQLTGRLNYALAAAASAFMWSILASPELAAQPVYAARIAAHFWTTRGCAHAAAADSLKGVTRCINGGLNGLNDRALWLRRVRAADVGRR